MTGRRKDLKVLARAAKAQGWTVDQTGGSHLRFRSPGGDVVTTSLTPSRPRSLIKAKGDLRRAGLDLPKKNGR